MDTWEWYNKYSQELRDAGQEYIPQLIDDFSESVLHLQIEKCDSLLPEMKALNQVAKNPWLEIFIGHWEMRHRLTNYEEGEKVLPDVVALFEKAHREEAKDCPQSICVTQIYQPATKILTHRAGRMNAWLYVKKPLRALIRPRAALCVYPANMPVQWWIPTKQKRRWFISTGKSRR